MAIKVKFETGETEKRASGLYQWDYGQTLEVEAPYLPTIVEVHFACRGMTEAIVRVCSTVLNVASVAIPDLCLEHTGEIVAWVYGIDGTSGRTLHSITIPIIARARPTRSEAIPEDVENNYTQLISEVNEAVEKLTEGAVVAAEATHAVNADRATQADNASSAAYAVSAGSVTHGAFSPVSEFSSEAGATYQFYVVFPNGDTVVPETSLSTIIVLPEAGYTSGTSAEGVLGITIVNLKLYAMALSVYENAVLVYATDIENPTLMDDWTHRVTIKFRKI
jgi:hypothetical protein